MSRAVLLAACELRVNATDSKGATLSRVEVFVDGRKVCETSPCLVEDLSPGNHMVKAIVGNDAVDQSVTIEARAEAVANLSVAGASSGSGTSSAPPKGTGRRVTGTQPGVRLLVDGREVGALPQDLRDLSPGEHKVRVVGSERYEPFEKSVTVAKDETLSLDNVVLKVLKGIQVKMVKMVLQVFLERMV